MARERLGNGEPLRGAIRIAGPPLECEPLAPFRLCRDRKQGHRVRHHLPIGLVGAVPFEHREFAGMKRAALAVAKHPCKIENARLARRQQLLAREFGRGMKKKGRRRAVRPGHIRAHRVQMRLIAR